MNAYFYTTQLSVTHPANTSVIGSLQKLGAQIHSNLEQLSTAEGFPKDIDMLVVLGRNVEAEADTNLSYVIALAVAYRKPILYLLPPRSILPEEIFNISQNKDIKKQFKIAPFGPKTIGALLRDFVDQYIFRVDSFAIKFTLRLNSDLHRYLMWKSKRAKMSKADFARKLIEDCMNEDEKFKKE